MNPFRVVVALLLAACLPGTLCAFEESGFVTGFLWDRFARLEPPERPRIALVLGGGGARGLAHIGVLKVLEEEDIPVDIIVGTSVGALVGSLYASGVPIEKLEKMGETIGWDDLTNISDAGLVRLLLSSRLLSTEKMENYLRENMGRRRFDELNIPFACVATDLITGERIVFREGEVALAARASSTIPGIFDPVEFRHRYLVDGGLYNNLPVDVARLFEVDFIVAVSVPADITKNDLSSVYRILTQAIYIQGQHLDREQLDTADFSIRPRVGAIASVDLGRSRECIEAGVVAARMAVPALKRILLEKTTDIHLLRQ